MIHGAIPANAERGLAGPALVGTASLVLGVKDVAYAAMNASTVVLFAASGIGSLAGVLLPIVRTNGVGFRLVSSNLLDTAGVGYVVFEP